MKTQISGSVISGEISAAGSKSFAHRVLIAAALSKTESRLDLDLDGDDIKATAACLEALGSKIFQQGSALLVSPLSPATSAVLDCGSSGSTLRFILPLAGLLCKTAKFQGSGRLGHRPIEDLITTMEKNGNKFSSHWLPFELQGGLKSGVFEISGNQSSQFVSALLMTLPLLEGDSEIRLTSPVLARGYVEITLEVLQCFGIKISRTDTGFMVSGNQEYRSPESCAIEGDWSNSAFFLAAGALAGEVSVTGLNPSSVQGDREIISILQGFGATPLWNGSTLSVKKAPLRGCKIDVSGTPDLLPILAVLATAAEGKTVLSKAATLRLKESDRLFTTTRLLFDLGGRVEEFSDRLEIIGGPLRGGAVNAFGDHRIAMAAAIGALISQEPVIIENSQAVSKSYPRFFEDFGKLGAQISHFEGSN